MTLADESIPILVRASKGTLLVTEKNALHDGFRQGSAIDHDKRLSRPATILMNGPGHDLLACSGLARNQNRNITSRRLNCAVETVLDSCAIADKPPP